MARDLSLKTTEIRNETVRMLSGVCGEWERSANAKFFRKRSAKILDELFFTLARKMHVENVLECGAHEGTASKTFLTEGGKRAITVEANPDIFERKTSKVAKLGAETLNIGLADKAGHLNFHIPEGNLGAASFRQKREGETYIEVPTTTIDKLHKDRKIEGLLALWVDVEGFAFEVLTGGKNTLKDPTTVLAKIEMEHSARWIDQKTFWETAPLLEVAGFSPVFSDMEYVHQFNVVYVRDALIGTCRAEIDLARNQLEDLALEKPSDV